MSLNLVWLRDRESMTCAMSPETLRVNSETLLASISDRASGSCCKRGGGRRDYIKKVEEASDSAKKR